MISEIFLVSSQLEPLAHKKYRFDCISSSKSLFIEKAKNSRGSSLQPHFTVSGIYFYHIKRNGLFIVATSKLEISPIMVIELLSRFYHIIKDFCGVVNEDSVRANILLISELLDELLEQGYVQLASTDKLRPFIQSEPVVVCTNRSPAEDISSRVFGIETRVTAGSAANKPAVKTGSDREPQKSELFVDVIERMTAVINTDGTVARVEVNGSVNMKNFLQTGSPQIKLSLNDDLVISGGTGKKGYGNQVQLDRCTFHQCVNLQEFNVSRVLYLSPPVGEFSAMVYTVSGDMAVNQPFTLLHFLSDAEGHRDTVLTVRLKSNFPAGIQAVGVQCKIPIPEAVSSVSQQLSSDNQSAAFRDKEKDILWKISKFSGKSEVIGQFRLISQSHGAINRHHIGPLALEFEISGYTSSGLHIRSLRVVGKEKTDVPQRWVRHITVSDSYIVRL